METISSYNSHFFHVIFNEGGFESRGIKEDGDWNYIIEKYLNKEFNDMRKSINIMEKIPNIKDIKEYMIFSANTALASLFQLRKLIEYPTFFLYYNE